MVIKLSVILITKSPAQSGRYTAKTIRNVFIVSGPPFSVRYCTLRPCLASERPFTLGDNINLVMNVCGGIKCVDRAHYTHESGISICEVLK